MYKKLCSSIVLHPLNNGKTLKHKSSQNYDRFEGGCICLESNFPPRSLGPHLCPSQKPNKQMLD